MGENFAEHEKMGQSLQCCSEMTFCEPEVLPSPSPAGAPIVSAQPAVDSTRCNSLSRDGIVLKELEKLFNTYAGKDGKLGVAEIAKIWQKCAHNKIGHELKQEEKRLIKESAKSYLQKIDLDHNGRVDRTEFYSFMLGGLDTRGPLCQMQEFLKKHMEANPEILQQALSKFIAWDVDGDGYISPEELRVQMDKFLCTKGFSMTETPFDVDDLLKAVDVDADGRIDLWEFLAYSMGRRKVPVELLLYDITQGKTELFSSVLLGKKFEAIYHSSILVHGKEFWYGGNIFMSEPPMSQHFGPTLEKSSTMKLQQSTYLPQLKSVHLGYTLMTLDEIVEYQAQRMGEKFTRNEYDVLTRNCNHYSNDLAQVLCGSSIPDVITQQPQLVMDAPRMRILVPLLNKWLGGFQDDAHATIPGEQELRDARNESLQLDADGDKVDVASDGPHLVSFDPSLVNGGLPSCETQFAQVLRGEQESVNFRYFDPKTCNFVEHQAPSAHLQAIDAKRPLGFDSIQSIASKVEEPRKGWLGKLRSPKRQKSQPRQKALGKWGNMPENSLKVHRVST